MTYEMKALACDPARLRGLSEKLVVSHYEKRAKRLINQWAADHGHAVAGATPILALDMYEHAYHMDYGAKAAAYVDAVMENIAWGTVARRLAALAT